jgi:hypothetical protein
LASFTWYGGTHVRTCAPALCVELPPEPPVAARPPLPATVPPPEPAALDGVPPKELGEPACEPALPPELLLFPAPPFALPLLFALPPPETSRDAPPLPEQAATPVSIVIPNKWAEKRILHG